MTRLPQPGGDAGNWGIILNEFLGQSHNDDGTLKPVGASSLAPGAVTANALADGAVTTSSIADGVVTEAKLDSALADKVNNVTSSVTMSGDVTGTSDASIVSSLNGIVISGIPAAGQVLKATSATAASWSAAGSTSVTLSGDVTGTTGATVVEKINGIAVTGTPTVGQVLKATSATAASWGTDEVGTGGGSTTRTVVRKSANYTAVAGDFVLAAGAITVTLPASPSGGDLVSVKKLGSGTGTVTVVPSSGATIEGDANWTTTTQYVSQDFISDGTDWYLV